MFTEEDLKLLDFNEDLKNSQNVVPDLNITAEMTQPLFEDLFTKIEEVQSDKEANVSILNFCHRETLQPVLAALGLYTDQEDLHAADWGTSKQEHQWKVSKIASFSANVAILLLECDLENITEWRASSDEEIKEQNSWEETLSEEEKSSEEEMSSEEKDSYSSEETLSSEEADLITTDWKVMVLHQERPVIQPACGKLLCSLAEFSDAYSYLASLEFGNICDAQNNRQE